MIVYWVLLGLFVFASLCVGVTAVIAQKKKLIVIGVSLFVAAIILLLYFIIYSILSPLLIVTSMVTMVGIGFSFKLSVCEIRNLINHNANLRTENEGLLEGIHPEANENESPCIILKSKALLLLKDICYIKSDGSYVEYYMVNRNQPEVDRNSLKKIIQLLSGNDFVQVCRSVVVNKNYVSKIETNVVYLKNGVELPFSNSYK